MQETRPFRVKQVRKRLSIHTAHTGASGPAKGMNALSTRMQHGTVGWIALAVLLLLFSQHAAASGFYPVEAIRPGMKGTGKTVLQGTAVETFEVEYIGVMKDAGPSGDLILVRVSGAAIDRSGGIAAGMSGSPVYIDDELVGAIGYGFSLADHRVGLVTPIGDMLDVFRLMDDGDDAAVAEGDPAPREAVLARSEGEGLALAATVEDDVHVFVPLRTPLLASGFGSRALLDLERRLEPFGFMPVQAGGAPADTEAAPLEPGSAFGVQLSRGDVSLTSIGTVTYLDGDRFVGFGHSFSNRGGVEFVVTPAYVHDVVQALDIPFKLGAALDPIGTLLQDRGAAVGGRLGPLPDMIPVTVSVHDVDRNVTSLHTFEIVRDNTFTVALATNGALALLDRSLDRLGRGTARIVFRVEGEGMDRPLVRDNVYYSDFDISALSLLEFLEAVSLVVNNRFQPVDVTRIHLSAQIEQERRTAHIEDVASNRSRVRPGETVELEVTLRPYRQDPVKHRLALTVPRDAAPGIVTVEVRGGGWGLRPPTQEEDTILDDPEEMLGETVSDLGKLVEQFSQRERNNELIAEFYAGRRNVAGGDEAAANDGDWHQSFPGGGWVAAASSTDYVLLGSQMFELRILPPPGDDEGEGDEVPADGAGAEGEAGSDGETTESELPEEEAENGGGPDAQSPSPPTEEPEFDD